jgi:hypothetical protein
VVRGGEVERGQIEGREGEGRRGKEIVIVGILPRIILGVKDVERSSVAKG